MFYKSTFFSVMQHSDLLQDTIKRAEDAINEEIQGLDAALAMVKEVVSETSLPPPASLDQAFQILLIPPSSERIPTSTPNKVSDRVCKAQAVVQKWLGSIETWQTVNRSKYEQQLKAATIEFRKKEKVLESFILNGHQEEAVIIQLEINDLIKRAASYQQQLLLWES